MFDCCYVDSPLGVAEQIILWLNREATHIHKSVGCVDITVYESQPLDDPLPYLLQGSQCWKPFRSPLLDRHGAGRFFGIQSYLQVDASMGVISANCGCPPGWSIELSNTWKTIASTGCNCQVTKNFPKGTTTII